MCSGQGCDWKVTITRKKEANGSYMSVSSLNTRHNDFCPSVAEPNGRQMACLPALIADVTSAKSLKRKAVVALVRAGDLVKLQRRRSTFYRVEDKIAKVLAGDLIKSFAGIPSILAYLQYLNGNDGRPVPNSGSGNKLSGSDADSVMTDNYNSEEWWALPLFEWRSSNFVESENNAMLDNGIRTSAPFNALYSIAVVGGT
ncbi:hypothetical protein F441_07688 [Phytophthora nicotianae CJ01A1]|uniref:Uncharacterized protein n=1 Tax=Phytophthora nicotianae CJ01A1 TaxID=1317063 RepID=W2X7Y5_PHYNI|nr:hypothetical protein F441_07688 [Phytophthora nicotianae CJ01A1]